MTRETLLSIDIQRDYFTGGAMQLPHAEAALVEAERLLTWARAGRLDVVHLQHVWDSPDATFMRPGTPGVEIHGGASPTDQEVVLTKESPNGFVGTPLESTLRAAGTERLVIMGMMTNMCVDATARAAADLGFEVVVAHDACAAADLEFNGTQVDAEQVQASFMAALADAYGAVLSADAIIG